MKSKQSINGLTQLGTKTGIPASPDSARLETFPNPYPGKKYRVTFDCHEFTSMCPVTGQPDFATIAIQYVPNRRCLESKSLKLYLGSFRNQGQFAETITNRILEDIIAACKPHYCVVKGDFTPRGGIAIEVVAEHGDVDHHGGH
jgi:7-cyano-7-deazaguanine reductase